MNSAYVLDAFALLAYLHGEPGGARVRQLLDEAVVGTARLNLSMVNYGEVVYVTERAAGPAAAEVAILTLDSLPIELVPADRALTLVAAHFKAHYRMSYADTFAAALALTMDAVLVTGDPEFKSLEGTLEIEWIAQRDA